jgi:hypothetical protein
MLNLINYVIMLIMSLKTIIFRPGMRIHCDLQYDPFAFMHDNNKVLGFASSTLEDRTTLPSLWGTVKGKYNLIY